MKFVHSLLATAMAVSITGAAFAAVSPGQAAKLGTTLTMVGAEKAGNAAGTIPAYDGGLAANFAPAGYKTGDLVLPDPFAAEKPRLVITSKNMAEYQDQLTAVTQELLSRFPDYSVNVYPTHRTVALPARLLSNSVKNATGARSINNGLGIESMLPGVAFPIPNNGYEAMWNHLTRYLGIAANTKFNTWNVDASGAATLATTGTSIQEWPLYNPAHQDIPSVAGDMLLRIKVYYSGPARRAGEAVLVQDAIDPIAQPRRAWQYLPGQRRVKLAPDIAYDTPNPGTVGTSTYDDVFMFNGAMDRFDFKLIGKKEMLIPYNTYKLGYAVDPLKYLTANYIDPDFMRWELHRVWVVEASLKPDARHIYTKRIFYLDEDSWVAAASDQYDARGQLFRGGYSNLTPNWVQSVANGQMTTSYDLVGGAYNVQGEYGAHGGIKYTEPLSKAQWSPESLAGAGIR